MASQAIGDNSEGMVVKHYAPVSQTTQDVINNGVHDKLTAKLGHNNG